MEKDVLSQVREELNERMTNPLLFCFISAWAINNYELFLIAFSSANIDYKLELFKSVLTENFWLDNIIVPAIYGALVFFIIPIFAYSKLIWEIAKNNLNRQMLVIQNNGPVSKSLVEAVKKTNRELKTELEIILDKLELAKQDLKSENENNQQLRNSISELEHEKANSNTRNILNNRYRRFFYEAASSVDLPNNKAEALLKEFSKRIGET